MLDDVFTTSPVYNGLCFKVNLDLILMIISSSLRKFRTQPHDLYQNEVRRGKCRNGHKASMREVANAAAAATAIVTARETAELQSEIPNRQSADGKQQRHSKKRTQRLHAIHCVDMLRSDVAGVLL